MFPGPLDVLIEPRECSLALVLVQAVVVRIAAIRKDPVLVLLRSRIIDDGRLGRGTVETRVACECGAILAEASSGGKNFLHKGRERGIFRAGPIQDGTEEEEDEGAGRDEEVC